MSQFASSETPSLLNGLVVDYLETSSLPVPAECCYRLGGPGRPEERCVIDSLRTLCDDMRRNHAGDFSGTVELLAVQPDSLAGLDLLDRVMSGMFSDQKVNWGRIAALFTLCTALAEDCVRKEMPNLVPRIIDRVASFTDMSLRSWINSHGGWAGLVEFCCPDTPTQPSWPSLTGICSFTVGAVGVFTMALFSARV